MMPLHRKPALARATMGLLVVALVLAGALGLVLTQPSSLVRPVTTTLTETTIFTSEMTSTATSTATAVSTTTVTSVSTQTIPVACSGGSSSGYSFGTLEVGTGSPAVICVELYEFNASSPYVLNPSSLISIEGVNPATGQRVNGLSNFTIAASQDSVELGGPTNSSEGIVVAFSITAKPEASGTYWIFLKGFQLGASEPLMCGPNGMIVSGTGKPDYIPSDVTQLCITLCLESCGESLFTTPGVSYGIAPGYLCYRFSGVTNSTQ